MSEAFGGTRKGILPSVFFRPRRALLPVAGLTTAALVMIAGAVGVAHALGPDNDTSTSAASSPASAQHQSADATVAALHRLTPPDAVALLTKSATPRQLHRLWHVSGVHAVAVLDTGRISVRGHHLHVVGVHAGRARSFTPALTAKSDALWQSIARGELTVGYAAARSLRHRLGQTLLVRGPRHHVASMRIGAFASLGLGAAEGVVSHARAMRLGLHPSRRLYIRAHNVPVSTIAVAVRRIFGAHVVVRDLRPHVTVQPISAFAQSTIPAPYLALYRSAAATCPGLPWTVLAGIGAVETGHGANVHRSVKGAEGPMQFLPSTFAVYGIDGNGDGVADIQNPSDAIYSAARYLCLWGAGRGGQALYDAIWAYNHADWYVRLVVQYANAYA
jgi:hypothetical protein